MKTHLNKGSEKEVIKPVTPWVCVILYGLMVSMNWGYAYYVGTQPDIVTNSWTVLFPFISYFYIVTCVIAFVGIYHQIKWGYGLGFFTIVVGAFLAAISYLIAYKLFPFIEEIFIILLVCNAIVILYMVIYSQCHPAQPDNDLS